NACACRKIEWRVARKAANSIASRRAAVDVLLIAQLVVVVGGIIALSCEKRLQTILATGVHWQKLFAIFPVEIVEQLRLGCSWDDYRRIWDVPCAGHRGRADARRGLIFGVAIEHKEIEILSGHLAGKRIRTNQSIAVTAHSEAHRNRSHRIGS